MKTLKKIVRLLALSLIIILAASGAGLMGAFLPNGSKQFMDKEIRIERIDKSREEEAEDQSEKN